MIVYDAKEKVYDLELKLIRTTEVHLFDGKFILVFFLTDGSKKFIMSKDVSLFCQVHAVIMKLVNG